MRRTKRMRIRRVVELQEQRRMLDLELRNIENEIGASGKVGDPVDAKGTDSGVKRDRIYRALHSLRSANPRVPLKLRELNSEARQALREDERADQENNWWSEEDEVESNVLELITRRDELRKELRETLKELARLDPEYDF